VQNRHEAQKKTKNIESLPNALKHRETRKKQKNEKTSNRFQIPRNVEKREKKRKKNFFFL
jgi:hypothetical protein